MKQFLMVVAALVFSSPPGARVSSRRGIGLVSFIKAYFFDNFQTLEVEFKFTPGRGIVMRFPNPLGLYSVSMVTGVCGGEVVYSH